nr:immunoglobulin heavy chain junction region [Macaca mulatta]MOW76823.1 immunoglobulin heavy chain junction region [Macaca mulatta]MOW77032.1 immunoglobulin heavy chain junction region [Macaca mulatta]MOW77249.1 immunoglobulin heavy chain junction region [Macaca mulatta]MOW77455.1 immunoglobulin heavy chain junction region [Macaca mulatta]
CARDDGSGWYWVFSYW